MCQKPCRCRTYARNARQKGYKITLDDKEADIVIVNTCSFIHDAEQESVQSILEMIESGKKVIVTGCLSQKYNDELKKLFLNYPEWLGLRI